MVCKHLALAEGKLPQAVRGERATPRKGIIADDCLFVPGSKAVRRIPPALVRVVQIDVETLRHGLGDLGLNCVVVSVLIVAVVADVLRPAAGPGAARRQVAIGVAAQQRGVGRTAVGRNS